MAKKSIFLKRYLSLTLIIALLLCMVATLSTTVLAEKSAASRYGDTYVHVDEFNTYTEEDAKHFEFLGNETGTFTITNFTTGTTTNNGVTITAKGSDDPVNGYLSAVLVNANKTVNQYVQADFTKASKKPMVWVRANKETLNDVEYLTGYFVLWDTTYYRLYKAEIVNEKYTLTQLARCGRMATVNDADFLSIEVSAMGTNPTVLNVKTYKNISGAYKLYDVQTVTDNTNSLQQKGTVALSATGTNAEFLKLAYHSDDGVAPNTYLLNESAKTGVLAGTVLTVEQNKTYEFSYITTTDKETNDETNDPVFIKYVSETKSGSYSVLGDISGFSFTREEYNGFNKFSGTFNLNTTNYTDLYFSYNLIATAENTPNKTNFVNVPIVVGINLNNAEKDNSKYKEFAVREVITNAGGSITYGPNLIVNGNFTLGAFNWSSELNVGINIGSSNNDALGVITNVEILDDSSSRYLPPNGRISVWQESNNFDYHYGFLYDPETALWGDANADGEIDIRDLVRTKMISDGSADYSVFADLSSYNAKLESGEIDGKITETDLTELRSILLNGSKKKYLVSVGNGYLRNTLEPQVISLKASIANTQTEISTNDKTVYYVSSNGNDNNDGLTESTPWKSIDKINSLGDTLNNSVICFKRGETFRGNIIAQVGVTYTAYGVGDKPMIIGSPENGADSSKWELVSGTENIYKYANPLKDVGVVIFNDGESYAEKRCPHIKNGEYTFGYEALENNQFISIVADSSVTYITDYDSYKNLAVNTLYLRCDSGNPAEVYDSIEFNTYGYVINGLTPYNKGDYVNENITVDNLDIRYTGGHGIGFSSVKNLTVQNCEISYIGGAIMSIYPANDSEGNTYYYAGRYGNGVEVTGFCDGYTVKNCFIHDIYDAGITHQNGRTDYSTDRVYNNVKYLGNLIENCCYSIEYFACGSSNGVNTTTMKNIRIADNIMRNAGTGLCEQRISNDSETSDGKRGFNYGTHINGWYNDENKSENFAIENNVFDRTAYKNGYRINPGLLIISAEDELYLPTLAGNTYIQHFNENFASFGLCDENLTWDAAFDIKAKGYARTVLGDLSCSVYYVE